LRERDKEIQQRDTTIQEYTAESMSNTGRHG
jgi:hypothetical protein